ncbi:seed lectin alpha chain-like [Argentina anserina]|uniref:seed lectin alpha chain-like n=1 Tax=Argentina anserina TaxID=57926 RepID=UPI002176813D|nr:seed lectin alpha chain-like [Potentilla anserina]
MVGNRSIRSAKLQVLLHALVLYLFLFCPSATPLSFEFPSFNQSVVPKLTTEGAAFIDTEFLRLTKSAKDEKPGGVGRAYYSEPFLLRDNATGLADFTTNFTFSIFAPNDAELPFGAADGLAFFIAPNGSKLNSTSDSGFCLGLPFNKRYPFVAVEFDIYMNTDELIPAQMKRPTTSPKNLRASTEIMWVSTSTLSSR